MANEHIEEVGLKFKADGSVDYINTLKQINAEMSSTYAEYVRDTAEMGKNATATEKLTAKKKMLETQIDSQRQKVEVLRREVDEMTASENKDQVAIEKKKKELAYAEAKLTTYKTQLTDTTKELKHHSEWTDKASSSLKDFGGKVEEAGKKASVVSAGIAAVGAASVKAAGDFQETMNKVNTLDLSASEEKIGGIKEAVLNLSAETGIAATDIAESTYAMGSALGELKDNTVDYVEVATKAAVGGFTETETAVNGLSTVMNAYGMTTVEEMSKISDQMLTAQNLGKTTFGEIAQSVGNVVPIFKQAGGSTEELFAAYAVLTKNGIQTSQATSGLKAALSNIIKPTEQASQMAASLGLNFSASAIQSQGLIGFLNDLRANIEQVSPVYAELAAQYAVEQEKLEALEAQKEKTKGTNKELNDQITAQKQVLKEVGGEMDALAAATDGPLAAYAQLFGSVEGLNSMLVLASDQGIKDYQMALEAMGTSTGATQEAFEKMNSGINTQIEILKTSIVNLGIQIGEILLPLLEPIISWLQNAVTWFASLDQGIQQIIVTVGLVVAAIGPVLILAGKLITTVGTLISLIPKITSGISSIGSAFSGFVGLISAHPVVSAITAVIAIIALLWTKCEWFRDLVKNLWNWIKITFQGLCDWLQGAFHSIAEALLSLGDNIKGIVDKIIEVFRSWLSFLRSVFVAQWTAAFTAVTGVLSSLFASTKAIMENVKGIFTGIINFIRSVFAGDWKSAWEAVVSVFGNVFGLLGNLVKAPINAVIQVINGAINGINKLALDIPDWVPVVGGQRLGFSIPNIPLLASGGALLSGMAIVAEAGPELIQQSGGRTVVTPLSASSSNSGQIDLSDETIAKLARLFSKIMSELNLSFQIDERDFGRLVREVL